MGIILRNKISVPKNCSLVYHVSFLVLTRLGKQKFHRLSYSFLMSEVDEIQQGIEVVVINDFQPESELPTVPHERQVVDAVIAIWKEDPSTESIGVGKLHSLVKEKHPNWSVSEKRVKLLLKKFGLTISASEEQYSYAKEIQSETTPDLNLPDTVSLVMTSRRGKGLYAKKNISRGSLIWEETQMFFVPPLANAELIKSGKACTFCGKLANQTARNKTGVSVLRGLDCNVCQEIWCSQYCKKLGQQSHGQLKHTMHSGRVATKLIDADAFSDLLSYCIKEQWNALYAIALIYADILLDKSGVKRRQFRAMARVSQKVRYKALDSSAGAFDSLQGGALFLEEQQENLWQEGYKTFCKVFPRSFEKDEVSFEEFMYMMGTYNINNLDSCVFLIQSHLNHNCDPNTSVETAPINRYDGLKVFAARDIKAGEELTTTYVNPAHTVQQRQRELRVNWGFVCKCRKCKDDLTSQQRRKSSSTAPMKDKKDIRELLEKTSKEIDGNEIELEIPLDHNGERRKSVRFDEKVVKVT